MTTIFPRLEGGCSTKNMEMHLYVCMYVCLFRVKGQRPKVNHRTHQKCYQDPNQSSETFLCTEVQHYDGTLGSSYTSIGEYPWVLICHTMGIPLGPRIAFYGSTVGS